MSTSTSTILTGLKITGSVLAVIIVSIIVIVYMSIYCIWPFKSLLSHCTPCKKTEDVSCPQGQVLLDNICVSQCKPEEIYTPDGCVKRTCDVRELQIENNLCVPDISGYYHVTDPNGIILSSHNIYPKHGTNVANVKSSGKILIDPVNKELIGSYGLRSTNFTDSGIEWNDGTRWNKLV